MNFGSVAFFGSCAVYGVGDPDGLGYVQRIRHRWEAEPQDIKVFNHGVVDETSHGLVNRIGAEVDARMPDVVIIQAGLHDAMRTGAAHHPTAVPVDAFQKNIVEILKLLDGKKIGLISDVPVNDTSRPQRDESYYGNDDIVLFKEVLRKVSAEYDIPFLDLFAQVYSVGDHRGFLNDSGLYMNERGHEFVANTVVTFLKDEF